MRSLLAAFILAVCSVSAAYSQENIFYTNIVIVAKMSLGLTAVPSYNKHHFNSDCIGFVKYVYYRAGLDLDPLIKSDSNGVEGLFRGLYDLGFLYKARTAAPGDLIFFDNTYDVNSNGLWDDPLTHIGIITEVTRHNTLKYVHYAGGEVKEYMINLNYTNTYAFKQKDGGLFIINSFLRRDRGEGYEKRDYISAAFYRCFGHISVKIK